MTEHLTDEQLDAGTTGKQWAGFRAYLEGARDQYEFRTPIYEHLTVAINFVDTLEAERAAHQATREAASDLVWSIEDCFERGLLTSGEVTEQEIRGRIRHWKDAARAGQGEGDE